MLESITPQGMIYELAGRPAGKGDKHGICRICAREGVGLDFKTWVRPSFTDFDKLQVGTIVCHKCQFSFVEDSHLLAKLVGKVWDNEQLAIDCNPDRLKIWQEKTKSRGLPPSPADLGLKSGDYGWCTPQKMRNYSHIVKNGFWYPLSKGDKEKMKELLLVGDIPELVVIAESGQKHLVFRGKTNSQSGSRAGYIQFEETNAYLFQSAIETYVRLIEGLMAHGCSKDSIERSNYLAANINSYGFSQWRETEEKLKRVRGMTIFSISLFLAQKPGDVTITNKSSDKSHAMVSELNYPEPCQMNLF